MHQVDDRLDRQWLDDKHWHLWHAVYYAPEDPRVFVPQWNNRPMGYTFNLARRQSWAILGIVLVAPVLIWTVMIIWL
jgi:uncharacterized membrane protein